MKVYLENLLLSASRVLSLLKYPSISVNKLTAGASPSCRLINPAVPQLLEPSQCHMLFHYFLFVFVIMYYMFYNCLCLLQVSEKDMLPSNICNSCSYKLELLHEFKEKSRKSEIILKQYLSNADFMSAEAQVNYYYLCVHGYEAVSYTHLDVYKRQAVDSALYDKCYVCCTYYLCCFNITSLFCT